MNVKAYKLQNNPNSILSVLKPKLGLLKRALDTCRKLGLISTIILLIAKSNPKVNVFVKVNPLAKRSILTTKTNRPTPP